MNLIYFLILCVFLLQVSFFSTSPELSNKQRFEYFLRTVPSDTNQADAMVQIILQLKWTYISILYEESNYGIQVCKSYGNDILIDIKNTFAFKNCFELCC